MQICCIVLMQMIAQIHAGRSYAAIIRDITHVMISRVITATNRTEKWDDGRVVEIGRQQYQLCK